MSSSTVFTGDVNTDPYFRVNHIEQITDALNLLVKHALLRGRRVLVNDKGVPFHFNGMHLTYRDPMIKHFVKGWLMLSEVDRTFHLINGQNMYDKEYENKMTLDIVQLDEVLFGE
jgi:hypothetical protein